MKEKILKLLETKFQGTRKDGLSILAGVLAMTATDDEAAAKVVDALTADQVKDFITDYRKGADAEITKANQTAEENLRKKYDFVEKGKKNDPEPPQPNIEEIIQKATAPLLERIAGLEGQGIKATRRAQFDKAIANAPDTVKALLVENFEGANFDTDEAFTAYLQKTSETASKLAQDFNNTKLGAMRLPQFGNNDPSGVSAEMKAYVDAKTKKS